MPIEAGAAKFASQQAAGTTLFGKGGLLSSLVPAAPVLVPAAAFLAVGGIVGLGFLLSQRKKRPEYVPDMDYDRIDATQTIHESTVAHQRVVFGEVTTKGVPLYYDSEGAYAINGYLLAAHEIDDVLSMSIDNRVLFTDSQGYVTDPLYRSEEFISFERGVQPQTGQIIRRGSEIFQSRRYIRANFRLGTNDQPKDAVLRRRIPSITEHYRQIGHATAFLEYYRGGLDNPDRFDYRQLNQIEHEHERIWGGKTSPPDPLFRIRGLKCWDPRTGKTRWTRNAALILGAILVHPTLSGRNDLDYGDFDIDAFKYAADACDEGFEIQPNSDYPRGAIFRKYTLDGVIQTSEPLISALQTIFLSSRTSTGWRRDKLQIRVSKSKKPVMVITDADFIGDYEGQLRRRTSDVIRSVRGQYRDPGNDGTLRDAPPADTSNEHGSEVNLVMSHTTGSYRAQHVMHCDARELELEKRVEGMLGRRAMVLEETDCVEFQSERDPQYSAKYIVWSKEMSLDGTQSKVVLTEWDPEHIFNWQPGFEKPDIVHPTKTLRSGVEAR